MSFSAMKISDKPFSSRLTTHLANKLNAPKTFLETTLFAGQPDKQQKVSAPTRTQKKDQTYEHLQTLLEERLKQPLQEQWQVQVWNIEPHKHFVFFRIDTTNNPKLDKPAFETWFKKQLSVLGPSLFPSENGTDWISIRYQDIDDPNPSKKCCGSGCFGCLVPDQKTLWVA